MPMRLLFLRGNGYLFDSGKGTYWTSHLDTFIANLLKGSTSEPKIENLLQISIINSSAFLYYRDNVGKYCIRHNVGSSYPLLAKWIEANGAQVGVQRDEYNVSLGPDGQFLALSNQGHQWNAISREFREHIQKMLTDEGVWKEDWEPSGALFGIHNSYVITCKGGRHVAFSSNLSKHYPGLEQRFQERFHPRHGVGPKYDYITLNPYAANEWVVVWADDTVSWSLSPSIIGILGPVTTWLSNKPSVHTKTSPLASASPSPSTTPAPTIHQTLPNHTASGRPASMVDETASFKPNPPTRPLSTASNISVTRPSAPAYHNSYPTATPTSNQYSTSTASFKPFVKPTYAASTYPANMSSVRPHLHGQSYSSPTLSRPTMWTHPNDTSTKEMLTFLHAFGKQMNQFSNNSSNSLGAGALSGLGGGPFQSGGDPTGGLLSGGGDPTGGMLSGGMGVPGMDPGSMMGMMGGMGMDPSSMMMQSQCSVM